MLLNMIFVTLLTTLMFGAHYASRPEPEPRVNVLVYGAYDECEGKDAANYTMLAEYTIDINGDYNTVNNNDIDSQLVQCGPNNQRAVNSLKLLARSTYPAGAYHQTEALWLITGGPIQGKYLYEKAIYLALSYLKRFSSVLGYAYVSTKSASLLINDNLDLAVLISPTGAYDAFKRGCTTQCRGKGYFIA